MTTSRLVFTIAGETEPPEGLTCDCGAFLPWPGFGRDYTCDKCHREYNSGGSLLAPRSQWGEETGETSADYFQGLANPDRAFDDP